MKSQHAASLRHFTNTLGLIDLGFTSAAFTWTNRQAAHYNIHERLDRAFSNSDWKLKFPNVVVNHLPIFASDHIPILISLFPTAKKRERYFMFENRWREHPDYNTVITHIWHQKSITAGSTFQDSLRHMVVGIQKWQRKAFRRIPSRISEIKQDFIPSPKSPTI